LVIELSVLQEKDRRTDNSMTKGKRQKNRQFNDQRKKTEEQTIQWSKEKDRRTDNSMTKGKRQKNRQFIELSVLLSFSFGH
jgi:hypothetical protein